jgi:osmotically inducible protein OsmC
LGEAGFTPDSLQTRCEVTFEGGAIKGSHLVVEGKVPGIDKQKFEEAVKNAEQNCPVSKALNVPISSEAKLSS